MGSKISKNHLTEAKTMENSLIHYLEQIPDFRKSGGLRHPLSIVLLIVIMAIMSGEYGYRAMERFIERHNE
jgi:hypothetical protein